MATKKETKIIKTSQAEITEGYVIFNVCEDNYVDEDTCGVNEVRDAYIYENQESAKEIIEESDYASDFEIHQVKMTFEVLKVIKRKVVYVEDDE